MKRWIILLLIGLVVLSCLSGCKDITDRFKPASFGNSKEEAAMVEALKEKYGDLSQKGEPRILEAMVTTSVDNYIPVDRVSKYSQNTSALYAWFVYDNFNEADIEVEWIYKDDNYSIHTFKARTGEDFGRAAFILEQPEDGWPLGSYEVIIRGHGLATSVTFEIIAGATVATPLEMVDGKITLSANPGWYFTGWEYFISSSDVTVVEGGRIEGRLAGTTGPGGLLYDYYESSGGKNDFSHSLKRKDVNGKILHEGSCRVTWTDPPQYLEPGKTVSLNFSVAFESTWGVGQKNVYFDIDELSPGYATAGKIAFTTPDGTAYLSSNYNGSLESGKVIPEGRPGDSRAIYVSLGNGYGFRYSYGWKEE